MTALHSPGGNASAHTRRTRRNDNAKEHRNRKAPQSQFSHDEWMDAAMPGMVKNLCRLVYENECYNTYADLEALSRDYGELVIDTRKVESAEQRACDLERVLEVAEEQGLVLIYELNDCILIELSDAAWKAQRKQAKRYRHNRKVAWKKRRSLKSLQFEAQQVAARKAA